ncbi:MAG: hypothetical protein BWK79_13875 [Beggiatoa sp. IS2]|nr:MAG: hypothetical protein BWK79_13875 [Beggiatoa sp. IS2]
MESSKKDLDNAVGQQLLSAEQAHTLSASPDKQRPKFDFAHVTYYLGTLLVIGAIYLGTLLVVGAMMWFMLEAATAGGWHRVWKVSSDAVLFTITTVYAICFGLVGHRLWHKYNLRVLGGLLFTLMVCMTPLVAYGLLRWSGFWFDSGYGDYYRYHGYNFDFFHLWWIWIKGGWFFMGVATIVVASITLFFIRFPFLTAPIAFALWYMSMDLTQLLFGSGRCGNLGVEQRWVSVWFGLIMLLIAYLINRRTKENYAVWLFLFGLLAPLAFFSRTSNVI